MEHRADLAIVGAGILGLAHAWAAARRGLRVVVWERSPRAAGASVRNFGLLWPIGQPHGAMYDLALQSRALWLDVLQDARLPYWPDGSLHLVYRDDEAEVAREFAGHGPGLGYQCSWLGRDETLARSPAIQPAGLTLRFYSSFQICRTLAALQERILAETPEYERWGIHGLVSQTVGGGLAVDIFNREEIDGLILRYIRTFLQAPHLEIAQRWYGIYAGHPERPYLVLDPAPGVRIATSPGGAGMTLSFGVAAKTIEELAW